jgi:hypothetical protein
MKNEREKREGKGNEKKRLQNFEKNEMKGEMKAC